MASRLLLFDIGNTNAKVGIAAPEAVLTSYSLPTGGAQTGDSLGFALLEILRHAGLGVGDITACVGSSVVPSLEPLLRHACERYLLHPLLLAAVDMPIPLENRYERPTEVGADRLVAAYAARRMYPAVRSIVSVDFGTATTFDCVDGDAYLGGLICPGVLSSAGALSSRTAKLPRVSLEVREAMPVVGQSTATSLNHGFIFGFAALAEGVIARLRTVMPDPLEVIATGGFARPISRVTKCFDHVRPDLILDGLRLLYQESGSR